jgi:hypothetical protein
LNPEQKYDSIFGPYRVLFFFFNKMSLIFLFFKTQSNFLQENLKTFHNFTIICRFLWHFLYIFMILIFIAKSIKKTLRWKTRKKNKKNICIKDFTLFSYGKMIGLRCYCIPVINIIFYGEMLLKMLKYCWKLFYDTLPRPVFNGIFLFVQVEISRCEKCIEVLNVRVVGGSNPRQKIRYGFLFIFF